mgnify:CR=1 FL=1
MSIFSWLRTKTRDAVLGGVQDALAHINSLPPMADPPPVLVLDAPAEDVPEVTNGRSTRQTARTR